MMGGNSMTHNETTNRILTDRFGKDSLIAMATVEAGIPHVRTVDAVYMNGAFYVVTYALSGKMQQIAKNPVVAVSGEWFTAHGIGENLGHVLLPENQAVMEILRAAFAAWYGNGHTNEADLNTCLLKIKLTDGVLFSDGTRYDIEFTS
jgi:general stress protein 26